jgi:hypothetical protein
MYTLVVRLIYKTYGTQELGYIALALPFLSLRESIYTSVLPAHQSPTNLVLNAPNFLVLFHDAVSKRKQSAFEICPPKIVHKNPEKVCKDVCTFRKHPSLKIKRDIDTSSHQQ